MKSAFLIATLWVISLASLQGCTPDHDSIGTSAEVVVTGKWTVDYYFDGQDQTAVYRNYEFRFMGDGTVECLHNSHSCRGRWRMTRDAARNEIMELEFTTAEPALLQLNRSWNVTEKDARIVNMKENSGQFRIRKL